MLAFDPNYSQEVVDPVARLRQAEASPNTDRERPTFTRAKADVAAILGQAASRG